MVEPPHGLNVRFGLPPELGLLFGLLLDEPLVPDCSPDDPPAATTGREVLDMESWSRVVEFVCLERY